MLVLIVQRGISFASLSVGRNYIISVEKSAIAHCPKDISFRNVFFLIIECKTIRTTMKLTTMMQRILVGCLLTSGVFAAPATSKATTRGIKILNESGSKVELFWVHPDTGETALMSTPNVMNGASFPLSSFVGHEFMVRELPSITGVCRSKNKSCGTANFTVSENDDQSEF
jgi:hypothetical protein